MTLEEFNKEYEHLTNIGDWRARNELALEFIVSLEQQNTALQARIKELEEPKVCDGCKHYESEDLYVGYCEELCIDTNAKWGCLSFEPKDS